LAPSTFTVPDSLLPPCTTILGIGGECSAAHGKSP
jgi:hypothetical protein